MLETLDTVDTILITVEHIADLLLPIHQDITDIIDILEDIPEDTYVRNVTVDITFPVTKENV